MSATRSRILLILIPILSGIVYSQRQGTSVVLNVDLSRDTISRHIYGQFAEHLGQCIYGGIWVGPGSSIPNTRGIRN
ncbi:MAG TPA: alpha-N-arabinofuranosidase, partial [Bacteroidetes bacterium]|nr:alpha-N-arabinofuranosidase [Bacteroidota bacterium]